jgi:YegS/Rv2252/BmrU family lipid kinase
MKILLVYNLFAGHKKGKKILPEIQDLFFKKNIDIDIQYTISPGYGVDIVKAADFSKYDGIVAAGGDGTLFEVINGYYQNSSEKRIPIGVIPIGTGNAFSRDLGIEIGNWKKAIEIIAGKQFRKFDVGKYTTEGRTYYYLNILGFGFVADVSETAKGLKMFGNMAYILGVFRQLIPLNSFKLTIEIDGQVLERENIFTEISNTKFTGATFLMAPNAQIDDGLLDVTLLNKCNRRRILKLFPTIFKGEHINYTEVESFKAKKIKIQTSIPKILTPDGEVFGFTPIEVECLKQDIEVFCE